MKTFLKYLLTFFSGFAFAFFTLLIVIIVVFSQLDFKSEEITIPENSILKIELNGEIKEYDNSGKFSELFGSLSSEESITLEKLSKIIKSAAKDTKIKAIELNPGFFSGGLAVAEEIRNLLDTFKKSGKPVYCYGENYSETAIYIASKANKIYANPKGIAEFNGFSSGIVMYKGLLDKLGVNVQVFKVGKFKGAVEPYTEKTLSEGNKEQIQQYLNDLFQLEVKQISNDRKVNYDQLLKFVDDGNSYDIKNLKSIGLIDDLVYYDQFEALLKSQFKRFEKISCKEYLQQIDDYEYAENKIAVLYLEGEIVSGKSESNFQIASENICKEIKKIRENDEIKSLVVRINSPGGSSAASDIIAREIEITKKVKPVIVSFGNVAASGGYYIGCVGDSIYADPKTITGSIGVFALIPNTQKLYQETLGLGYQTVNSSKNAEIWRPDQPLTEFQQKMIQNMIDNVYQDFIGIVSKGRKIPIDRVNEIAQGKVYSGIQAKKIGLIDGFGNLDYAVRMAAKKSQLKSYRVVKFPQEKDPFEEIYQLFNAKISNSSQLNNPLANELIKSAKELQSMHGVQARLPWSINLN